MRIGDFRLRIEKQELRSPQSAFNNLQSIVRLKGVEAGMQGGLEKFRGARILTNFGLEIYDCGLETRNFPVRNFHSAIYNPMCA